MASDGSIDREAIFRALFEHTADIVIVFDVESLRIQDANPAATKLFENKSNALVGRCLSSLSSGGRALWEQGPTFYRAVPLQTSSGVRWFDLRLLPYEGSDEKLSIAVGHDVTEERVEADAAAAAEVDLRRTQKLDAGGIAHDFNNILSVILNYAALLMGEIDEASLIQDLEEIERAAMRAADLTKRLLVLGRRDPSKPERLDVSQHLRTLHPLLQKALGADVRLGISAPEVPDIPVQSDLLEEVLINLATNAHDALRDQDIQHVQIATSRVDEEEALELGLAAKVWVRLRFQDSGPGIKPDLREKVFEPFFSTKPSAEGAGLGLAMVESIVSGCGGHIRLESDGEQTRFDLYFPAIGDVESDNVDHGPDGSDFTAPLTLLLVDDEREVRRSLRRLLELKGHTVIGAGSGSEALAIWQERAAEIDLLISDVLMPGMTGLELTRQLRASSPGLCVLYVSGYSDSVIPLEELESGTTDILLKPFTADALITAINALVEPSGH